MIGLRSCVLLNRTSIISFAQRHIITLGLRPIAVRFAWGCKTYCRRHLVMVWLGLKQSDASCLIYYPFVSFLTLLYLAKVLQSISSNEVPFMRNNARRCFFLRTTTIVVDVLVDTPLYACSFVGCSMSFKNKREFDEHNARHRGALTYGNFSQ